MPRTRRRRANDRRREAEQRRIAAEALAKAAERQKLGRYVKSVYKNHTGEVVQSKDGKVFQVEEDGSLKQVS